jgi:hypothetical protein
MEQIHRSRDNWHSHFRNLRHQCAERETGYLLFVVSGFIGVVIALQLILSRVTRPSENSNQNTAAAGPKDAPLLRDWLHGDFDIQEGPLRSAEAAIIIILPIAAAAIGMMAFGIEFQIVEHAGV